MPIINCNNCNKSFNKPAPQIERAKTHFCTKECYWQYQSKKQNIECDNCNKPLLRTPYKIKSQKHHFCDKQCQEEWNKTKAPGRATIFITCAQCNKKVKKFLAETKRQKNFFCSKECMGKYRSKHFVGENASRKSPRIKVTCRNCGKVFEKTPYTKNLVKNHYCSHKCRSEHGRITKPCTICNKPISAWKSRESYVTNFFCSRRCFSEWRSINMVGENNPSYAGGKNYYGPNWKRQRREARKRDNYKCQSCGITEKKLGRELDVHHIKPFKSFCCTEENKKYKEANKLTNLISLCPSCHKAAEWGKLAIQPNLI